MIKNSKSHDVSMNYHHYHSHHHQHHHSLLSTKPQQEHHNLRTFKAALKLFLSIAGDPLNDMLNGCFTTS